MPRLYVGTNGLAVWSSNDLGDTLTRMGSGMGMYSGSQVWALSIRKGATSELLAGTNSGIYRLDPDGARWWHMPSPMDKLLVTSLACSPHHPDVMLAGTQPAALYRTEDAGKTWRKLDVPMKPYATIGFQGVTTAQPEAVKHWTRVTQIVFDPKNPSAVWAGVEIDSAWRSTDGGEHWERTPQGFISEDVHGFGLMDGEAVDGEARTLFATTEAGLHESRDGGASWTFRPIPSDWQYVRSIAERADHSGVLFLTNGNGAPGTRGRLWRSCDRGAHWEDAGLPGIVESSLYFLAVNAADPNLVFAAATLGQLYRSTDGGETWAALRQRLGEIRCLAWLPD